MKYKTNFITAIRKELEIRKDYVGNEPIETIYFGGGTPSQLSIQDFEDIFETIYRNFPVAGENEITLEANPDDLTKEYVRNLRSLPFNRLSMGIQSFNDADLLFLNRRHSAKKAYEAVSLCQNAGLKNISIDLIYGLPGQSPEAWIKNIEATLALSIPHISAYHLTYEEGTGLYHLKEKGKIKPVDEDTSIQQFNALVDKLTQAGFIHYEISNFAKPGFIARHNSSYWKGIKYLGIGPSAHSYNGVERQWNISDLPAYIKGITDDQPKFENEQLDISTCYNDYLLTSLRTMWGADLNLIKEKFGEEYYSYCIKSAKSYIQQNLIYQSDNILKLSRKGMFVSDGIITDMLWI